MPILFKETRHEKSEHRGLGSRRVGHHHARVRRVVALGAGDCGHRCVPHPAARVRGVYLWLRAYRSDRVSRTDIRSGRAGDRGGRSRQRVRAGQIGQLRGRLIGPRLTAGGLVRGLAVDSAAALRGLPDLGGESRHDGRFMASDLAIRDLSAGPSCWAAGRIFSFSILEGQISDSFLR